jgi:HK97 family phage major capsid protein
MTYTEKEKYRGQDKIKFLREEMADKVFQFEELKSKNILSTEENQLKNKLAADMVSIERELEPLEAAENRAIKNFKMSRTNRDEENTDLTDFPGRTFIDKSRSISLIDSKTRLLSNVRDQNFSVGDIALFKTRGPQNATEKAALDTGLDAAGGISTIASRQFWDYTRQQMVVFQAGAQTLDFESDEGMGQPVVPQITGSVAPEWKAQNAPGTPSDPTFIPRPFAFKTLFASTVVSNELAQDGGQLLARMITHDLAQSFASEADRVALTGSGSGEEPRGVANTLGINVFEMGTNGGPLTDFNPMVGAVAMLLNTGLPLDKVSAFVLSPRSWQELATLKSQTELQQLIIPSHIAQIPQLVSNKINDAQTVGSSTDTSSIFVGDFTQLVVGVRLAIKLRFNEQPLAGNFSTLITAAARLDVQLINPSAFTMINGITPGGALT